MSLREETTDTTAIASPPAKESKDPYLAPATATAATEVTCGGVSHVGNVRQRNEDHFVAIRRTRHREILFTNAPLDDLSAPDDHAYVFVVADGMGGAACGDIASRVALQAGFEWGTRSAQWLMKMNDAQAESLPARAQAWAHFIQGALRKRAKESPALAGMGTTLTAAYVMGQRAIVAHIGDSRCYVIRGGSLHRLTRDHTVAQELLDAGYPPGMIGGFRHLLTNCLGTDDKDARLELHEIELQDGDGLLLCTDGLNDALSDAQIEAILKEHAVAQVACQSLLAAALETPAKDNVTAVLARFRFAAP
jgi:protein phosphatase